jgi:hypothetical protein
MFFAFGVVLVLIVFCPVVLVFDRVLLVDFVPIAVAAGLAMVALRSNSTERQRASEVAWTLVLAAVVLGVWILVQLLPLPISTTPPLSWLTQFTHPVWTSAADALQRPMVGWITVDTGVTLVALVKILALLGAALLTLAVTMDRGRAEIVLVGLTIASATVATIVTLVGVFDIDSFTARSEALDVSCVGLVLSAACGALVYDRWKSRTHHKRDRNQFRFDIVGTIAVGAFLVSLVAILAAHSGSLLFAASGGFGTFCAVVIVRRLALGRWGAIAIGATAIVIGIALVLGAAGTNPDPRLAFVRANAVSLELTQRILADSPLFGTGAGTFASLVPIYRPSETGTEKLDAVTAAAKVSIELGRPMLWLSVAAAVIAALVLLRASLHRGRDYFHAAAGAAILVTATTLAFVNVGLVGTAPSLLLAIALGLALAQAKGTGSA